MTTAGTVTIAHEGAVAIVTFSNPERLNAVDRAIAAGLADAVGGLRGRDDVGAVVLRGAGASAFSAGVDLKYVAGTPDRAAAFAEIGDHLDRLWAHLDALAVPAVALIRGVCYGAGIHIACMTDFRFAAADARLAIPAVKNELFYPLRALTRLSQLMGVQKARRMLLDGQPVEPAQLQAWGFLDEVRPPDAVEAGALDFARRLAGQPRPMVEAYRRIFAALDAGDVALADRLRRDGMAQLRRTRPPS